MICKVDVVVVVGKTKPLHTGLGDTSCGARHLPRVWERSPTDQGRPLSGVSLPLSSGFLNKLPLPCRSGSLYCVFALTGMCDTVNDTRTPCMHTPCTTHTHTHTHARFLRFWGQASPLLLPQAPPAWRRPQRKAQECHVLGADFTQTPTRMPFSAPALPPASQASGTHPQLPRGTPIQDAAPPQQARAPNPGPCAPGSRDQSSCPTPL